VRPVVTEYQLHTLTCGKCGSSTRATLPEGVTEGCFGPRVQATIALMTGVLRVSRRSVQSFLADSFGLQMSLGAISKQESIASMALIAPVSEALEYVRNADIVHADETSWRERGRRSWLWTAVAGLVIAFLIRPSRGRVVALELLGPRESGVTVSDRYGAYSWIEAEHRQLCWAHLIRDFRRIEECGSKAAHIGKRLLECSDELFAAWHRVRDGTLPHEKLASAIDGIPERVRKWLRKGAECKGSGIDGLCRGILREEPSMWTFVKRPGVEPTNNDAERAIRPAVLLRKCSQGTQSFRGNLFVERLQTVSATLRRQGRNVHEYLVAALQASRLNQPAPSLLPIHR
jgi:transposase